MSESLPATTSTADQCPQCGGRKIQKRSTGKSVVGALIFLLITGAIFGALLIRPDWDWLDGGVRFVMGLTLLVAFASVIAAALGTWLGKNRCRDCKHLWH